MNTARLRGGSPARGPRPAPIRANLRSGSVSCSLFGRRPTASAVVFDVSSSEAAPPPHLHRLAPLAPREPTARVGPPRAGVAALCLVATPPREVGPALPGRRIAPAPAASLSSSARPSPPLAPHRARGGVALLVADPGGPAATAAGLPGELLPLALKKKQNTRRHHRRRQETGRRQSPRASRRFLFA